MNRKIKFYRTLYRFLTHPDQENAENVIDDVIRLYDPLKERLSLDPADMRRVELLCAWDNLHNGSPQTERLTLILPAFTDLFQELPRKASRLLIEQFLALASPENLLCSSVVGIVPEGNKGLATVTIRVSNPALLLRVLDLYGDEVKAEDHVISHVPRWIEEKYKG